MYYIYILINTYVRCNVLCSGNEQGKMQKDGVLKGGAKEDYLLQPFQSGKLIVINIPLPFNGGQLNLTIKLTVKSFPKIARRRNMQGYCDCK